MPEIDKIKKRDGRIVEFHKEKITDAISKALAASNADKSLAEEVSSKVTKKLTNLNQKQEDLLGVEKIQDVVVETLRDSDLEDVADTYQTYREKRSQIREAKWWLLNHEVKTKLAPNSVKVLENRYLQKNAQGKIVETPQQLFRRVASNIASAEKIYNPSLDDTEIIRIKSKFFRMMASLEFLPNSPTLMNAGGALQQLSACFVLPVKDSMESIFEQVKHTALIHKSGGGTGFGFSRLRPRGDIVKSTGGIASGPISFMSVFDAATNVIKQGGCIANDSRVRTDQGVVPLAEFLNCPPLGQNQSDKLVYTNGEFENAFLAEDNGEAEVYKIKTEIGTEISSTYNHSLGVVNEKGKFDYKKAEDIEEGDWIIHVLGGHTGADAKLPQFKRDKQHFNANEITIPNRVTPELAELLGFYMADGCTSYGRIIFSIETQNTQLQEHVKDLMKSAFGLETCRIETKPNDESVSLVFYSRDLCRYFEKVSWTKESAKKAFVPEAIFTSSRQSAYAFLRGLFDGDGDVHSDGYPRLYSVSKQLVSNVQQLLFGLGIVARFHKYMSKDPDRFGSDGIYHLTIIQKRSVEEFIKNIAFISDYKNDKLQKRQKNKATERCDIIPNQGQLLRKLYDGPGRGCGKERSKKGANRELYRALQHYLSDISSSSKRNLPRKKLKEFMQRFEELDCERLQKVVSDEYFYSRVEEVSEDKVPTMDITVPTKGHFVANSILVHNKRRGANMGVLRVDHPDIIEFITAKEEEGKLSNFNISVGVTNDFMDAVKEDEKYDLKNPRTKKKMKSIDARRVFNLIVEKAWTNGEPGVIFLDKINEQNPTPHIGEIESTNPCVMGDTRVATKEGLVPIKDLARDYPDGGAEILTDKAVSKIDKVKNKDKLGALRDCEFNTISKAFKTGTKECFKLITKSGYELKATADHKIMTTEGWKPLEDLKEGVDEILVQPQEGGFSQKKKLPFEVENEQIGKNGKKYELNLPTKWSEELGEALGWIIGDGWLREGKDCRVGLTFGKKDEKLLDYFKKILNSYYGKEIQEQERENDVYHLSYHSKYFVDFFKKLGVKPVSSSDKEVPESIYKAPKKAVIGFLRGLFSADGTVRDNSKSNSSWVALSSKNEFLLKGVQRLLLNLGIKSVIMNRSRKPRKGVFKYTTKDGEERSYDTDGILYELGIFGASREKFKNKINFLLERKKRALDNIQYKRFYQEKFYEEVNKIESIGKREVYDLTEPKTHSMICNGLVIHQCGEQPLLPYESCNLGSINLVKMVDGEGKDAKIDWDKLKDTVHTAVRFLDNVIDMNEYPIPEIEERTKNNRKIGLGVMGFANMLIKMRIPYGTDESLKKAGQIMKFIQDEGHEASAKLAEERGVFPNYEGSVYDKNDRGPRRNATVTTLAPTGTISIIANTSSGIEPLFSVAFKRKHILGNEEMIEVNDLFEEIAKEKGFWSEDLKKRLPKKKSIQDLDEIPDDVKKYFQTALDVDPIDHVRMQAVFQSYTDNAVSKTINFPYSASKDKVKEAYLSAYNLDCKGLTLYRNQSRKQQVLNIDSDEEEEENQETEEQSSEFKDPTPRMPGIPPPNCPTCHI